MGLSLPGPNSGYTVYNEKKLEHCVHLVIASEHQSWGLRPYFFRTNPFSLPPVSLDQNWRYESIWRDKREFKQVKIPFKYLDSVYLKHSLSALKLTECYSSRYGNNFILQSEVLKIFAQEKSYNYLNQNSLPTL